MSFSWLRLLLLAGALTFVITLIQLEILSTAFEKLGLTHEAAYALLAGTLLGSLFNIPLFRLKSQQPDASAWAESMWAPFRLPHAHVAGQTIVAVNVGGCLVPVIFSLQLLGAGALSLAEVLMAVAAVASIAYAFSRPVSGVGIAMPVFVSPVSAALVATLLDFEQRAPLAYIGGTLGVLLGADVLRLKNIRAMGAPIASIGGAGTFDGIFLAGLLAVLLT